MEFGIFLLGVSIILLSISAYKIKSTELKYRVEINNDMLGLLAQIMENSKRIKRLEDDV